MGLASKRTLDLTTTARRCLLVAHAVRGRNLLMAWVQENGKGAGLLKAADR